jgi:BlaI family transcriptional regulator, penicillinase repressor
MKSTATKPPRLSEAQMEIMEEVWKGGEVTVTKVWEALESRRGVARNTVHTLMERLTRKGWLKRRMDGQVHYYSARSTRTRTMKNLVNRLVDSAFGGSAESLVLTLLQGRTLTPEEAGRIRDLIDQSPKKEAS